MTRILGNNIELAHEYYRENVSEILGAFTKKTKHGEKYLCTIQFLFMLNEKNFYLGKIITSELCYGKTNLSREISIAQFHC